MAPVSATKRTSAITLIAMVVFIGVALLVGIRIGNSIGRPAQPAQAQADAENKAPGGALVNPPFEVKDFTLTDQQGRSIALKSLRDRVVVLFFGYTHCPDVCPTTLAEFTRVKQILGDSARNVAFVFVSIDAKRDTPDVVRAYLANFDSTFIGLTGEDSVLQKVAAQFGGYFRLADGQKDDHDHKENVTGENYFIEHTSPAYVIDRDGYLKMIYFYGSKPENLAAGVEQLLKP